MIYIVRHGETDWNIQELMQGHRDVPLNTKGRVQAEEIAKDLKNIYLNVIYSSPLSRAYETACIINAFHKAPIIKDNDLRERRFGDLEGKPYKEINAYHAALLFSETWNYPDYRPPHGESVNDVKKRVIEFTKKILQKYEGETVLIVSHGVTQRILTAILLHIPPKQFNSLRLKNASMTLIELQDQKEPTLHIINYLPLKNA